MSALLLMLAALAFQVSPPGVVTGVVHSAPGAAASGVRVYAQQFRDATDPNSSAAPLEGLVETDANGRYRLELPPGRYYIASGSVSAPTYFPGTLNLAEAKLITVTTGGTVEGIDFGSFIRPANLNRAGGAALALLTAPAGGSLSGIVRNADGSPAAGVTVVALPWNLEPALSLNPMPAALGVQPPPRTTATDGAGRYRILGVPADSYFIAAGFAEAAGFFTLSASTTTPRPIVLSTGGAIDALDVTLPSPPPRTGTTVSGRVVAADGVPAAGATARMTISNSRQTTLLGRFLPSVHTLPDVRVAGDGTFHFSNVAAGHYNMTVWTPGGNPRYESITVESTPIDTLRFSLSTVMFSGRVVLEDGSIPNRDLLAQVAIATTNNPNIVLSTILPLGVDGTFAGIQPSGEFRFYFPILPGEYEIRSITAGSTDLLKETLKLDGSKSVFVDVRLARAQSVASAGGIKVTGIVLNAVTKMAIVPTRIVLCCQTSGAVEAYSATVGSDGSFEFSDVTPGSYFADLKPQTIQKVSEVRTQEGPDGVKLEVLSGGSPTPAPPISPITIGKPR